MTRQIGRHPEFSLDEYGFQCLNTMFMLNVRDTRVHPKVLRGILNSSAIRAYWLDRFFDQRRTFPKIKGTYLKQLPIVLPKTPESERKLILNVDAAVQLRKDVAAARTDQERVAVERQIKAADRQIDKIVHELYGLTDEEILIVESVTSDAPPPAI